MEVDGARVLVTGASSGIGAALAPLLAARGAVVAIVARRRDRLEEVLARCREHAPDSVAIVADLGDLERAVAVVDEAWEALGCIDVLVNNAAMPKRRRVTALRPEEVDEVMRLNFTSPVRMTLRLLPRLLERGRGVIVNVSSLGGRLGIAHEAAYCASKFALAGWSEAMAIDLWDTGVEVRLVLPGPVDTEIWDRPGSEAPLYRGPFEPPGTVAEAIVAAIEGERFETYAPDLRGVVEFKTTDIDAFLEGSAAMGRGEPR
jgi:short-subunit dehydrogenase